MCVCFPPVEIARGRCPHFSLRNKSFIVRVSGSSETKSSVVPPSIKVAVRVRSATSRRSLAMFAALSKDAWRRVISSPSPKTPTRPKTEFSWAQQGLDRAALVHRAIALSHLIERQNQIEHLARVDLPVPHQVNQLG